MAALIRSSPRRWGLAAAASDGLVTSLLLALLLMLPSISANEESTGYPSKVQFKAGVLHAPPFAMIDGADNNKKISYSGFQIDLLERLKIFASEDGVDLQMDLSPAPSNYGKAFNLVASDCNTTDNENLLEDCQQFDMIIGDFYCNADRYTRADFSPSWLKTTMTTIKHTDKPPGAQDFTTLRDAEKAGATVCVPAGTYLSTVVMEKFPKANFIECNAAEDECAELLKKGDCVLFSDDELLLHYKATADSSLEVTRESFNTQYLVWPIRDDLSGPHAKLLKKWMYRAVQNATLDELYFQYFKQQLCPHGTAGENCELPCDANHGGADAQGKCVCKSSKWTGDDCSIEVMEELNLLPTAMVSTCYGLAGINFVLVAVCALWLLMNRHRSHVRMAQPTFLVMILIGCAISTSTIFVLAREDEGEGPVYSCAAVPWFYSVGFCLTFGALFARIKRIYTIMGSAARMRRVQISSRETVLTVALVLGIDVTILTVWTVLDPLQWTRVTTNADLFGEPLESEGYCESEHWQIYAGIIAAYHIALMMVACFMCYLARTIPDRISNGKYVAIAMFSNLQIMVIAIPILVILGSDPEASFFVRSAAIWINDFVVLILIFGNLVYKVHAKREQASTININRDIRKFAQSVHVRSQISDKASRVVLPSVASGIDPDFASGQLSNQGDSASSLNSGLQQWPPTKELFEDERTRSSSSLGIGRDPEGRGVSFQDYSAPFEDQPCNLPTPPIMLHDLTEEDSEAVMDESLERSVGIREESQEETPEFQHNAVHNSLRPASIDDNFRNNEQSNEDHAVEISIENNAPSQLPNDSAVGPQAEVQPGSEEAPKSTTDFNDDEVDSTADTTTSSASFTNSGAPK